MAQRVTAPGTLFLDSEGLSKAATGDVQVRAFLQTAFDRRARVVVSAMSLTETLRGGPRDTNIHRVLRKVTVIPVSPADATTAGRLLGKVVTRNDATVDAVIAVAAMAQPRPVLLLTSDPKDMGTLTAEAAQFGIEHV